MEPGTQHQLKNKENFHADFQKILGVLSLANLPLKPSTLHIISVFHRNNPLIQAKLREREKLRNLIQLKEREKANNPQGKMVSHDKETWLGLFILFIWLMMFYYLSQVECIKNLITTRDNI